MSETAPAPTAADAGATARAEVARRHRKLAWNAIFPHIEYAFENDLEDRSLQRITVVRGTDATFVAVLEAGDVNQVDVLAVSAFTDEQGRDVVKVSYPSIDPGLGEIVTGALERARARAAKRS